MRLSKGIEETVPLAPIYGHRRMNFVFQFPIFCPAHIYGSFGEKTEMKTANFSKIMQKETGMNTGTVSYGKENQKCSRGFGLMQTTEEPIGSGTDEEHAESRALPRIAEHKCMN